MNSTFGRIATAALLLTTVHATVSNAAGFPDRPVHFVVGYEAGGGADTIARFIAQNLSERWGQPVLVENRPGADGTIAADYVARAKPDGYTIMMITFTHAIVANERILNYDPINDFTPVIQAATQPDLLLINPSVPANSVKELIALARSNPSKLNFASTGVGGPPFLDMALLMAETNIKLVDIAYKGTGPALVAGMAGEVQVVFGGIAAALPLVNGGKLKPLAITGGVRSPLLPNLPTVAEAADMKEFEGGTWEGIVAPAKVPSAIVNQLHDDAATALKSPDVSRKLSDLGFIIVAGTPEEFAHRISGDISKWGKILKNMGINPQ